MENESKITDETATKNMASNLVLADSSKPLLEWVRIADRMPEDSEVNVMVVGGSYGSITIMRGAYIHYITKDKGATSLRPTYWMPLPALPSVSWV